MDLSGEWQLSDGTHEVPFAMPGDVVSALHAGGVIADPYHGRNEYECRWISERDWVARRVFDHDGGSCDLVIDGLDTVAEVRLNGHLVLAAANAQLGKTQRLSALYSIDEMPRSHIGKLLKTDLRDIAADKGDVA